MASFEGAAVEPLENRLLMAVTITLSSEGRLNIVGDAASDVVEVVLVNGERDVLALVNGTPVDLKPKNATSITVKHTSIQRIVADMGAGDDEVYIGHLKSQPRPFVNHLAAKCVLVGGDGNDILEGGRLSDTIIGGAGDDILFGDRGHDLIFGGSGNDQILGENGRDNLFGQDGDDRLNGGGNEDDLYGMSGADDLVGGEDRDFLNPGTGPGDTHDTNEKPDAGQTGDVTEYVRKLIQLAVPEKFRAQAKA
jgi:Ca2+-binding RTX toxin-like protein